MTHPSVKDDQTTTVDLVRIAAFNGSGAAGTWEFQKELVTVGRVASSDVCLDDKKISRTHCTIELLPEGLLLRDGGSSNGTWVNGQKISRLLLKANDAVVVSGYRLQIELVRAPASSAWDSKTPAEASNVVRMRARGARTAAPAPIGSPLPANDVDLRTEVVDPPKMEAEALEKSIQRQIEMSEAKPMPRPIYTRPGGAKRGITTAAPMSRTNALVAGDAPLTIKVDLEKQPLSNEVKIALVLGGLFAVGLVFLVTIAAGIAWYVLTHAPPAAGG